MIEVMNSSPWQKYSVLLVSNIIHSNLFVMISGKKKDYNIRNNVLLGHCDVLECLSRFQPYSQVLI